MKRSTLINKFHEPPDADLIQTVKYVMYNRLGVLGMDEHASAFNIRFLRINRSNTWDARRQYRQFICTAPLQEQFSTVIVSEELMQQCDDEANYLFDILKMKGVMLAIRVDTGLAPLFGTKDEYTTTGLETINERLKEYKNRGCKFAKWRSAYMIKLNSPSLYATRNNSTKLSSFAWMSQNIGLVPIISLEVLPDGSEDIDTSRRVLEKLLINAVKGLHDYEVLLEATILQISFVQAGHINEIKSSVETMAENTLEALRKSVPVSIGGIMFHSSGLSEELATLTFNHVMTLKIQNEEMNPWKMMYSFGRAMQASALKIWQGDSDLDEAGHKELLSRAEANNRALLGKYEPGTAIGAGWNIDLFTPDFVH